MSSFASILTSMARSVKLEEGSDTLMVLILAHVSILDWTNPLG